MRFLLKWDLSDGSGHEILDQTEITVPNMSLSVKDIINRFSRGTLDLRDIERNGYYDEEQDIDDTTLDDIDDLVDVQQTIQGLNDKVSESVRRDRRDLAERAQRIQEQGRETAGMKSADSSADKAAE